MKQPCNAHAYEQEKKEQQKQFLIDMMEEAEKLGLYDIFNDEKRQGVKDLIDTHKQRLEKYSERFDNDKSEIGNPDTWGKRVVEEPKQYFYCSDRLELDENERCITQCENCAVIQPKYTIGCDPYDKQETLEEASWKFNPLKKLDGEFLRHAFKEGAKWQEERMYSEEDMRQAFNNGAWRWRMHSKVDIFKEWLKTFKNK